MHQFSEIKNFVVGTGLFRTVCIDNLRLNVMTSATLLRFFFFFRRVDLELVVVESVCHGGEG